MLVTALNTLVNCGSAAKTKKARRRPTLKEAALKLKLVSEKTSTNG